jgi:hypothetical protein
MIFDVSAEIQMAIRLHAVKRGITTGETLEFMVRQCLPKDVEDAVKELAEQGGKAKR